MEFSAGVSPRFVSFLQLFKIIAILQIVLLEFLKVVTALLKQSRVSLFESERRMCLQACPPVVILKCRFWEVQGVGGAAVARRLVLVGVQGANRRLRLFQLFRYAVQIKLVVGAELFISGLDYNFVFICD